MEISVNWYYLRQCATITRIIKACFLFGLCVLAGDLKYSLFVEGKGYLASASMMFITDVFLLVFLGLNINKLEILKKFELAITSIIIIVHDIFFAVFFFCSSFAIAAIFTTKDLYKYYFDMGNHEEAKLITCFVLSFIYSIIHLVVSCKSWRNKRHINEESNETAETAHDKQNEIYIS